MLKVFLTSTKLIQDYNMYTTKFHRESISNKSFLVTGGAGFIGSNIVEYLIKYGAKYVRVLDNLSNGYYENILPYIGLSNFEFINGDIRDLETCKSAVSGIHYVSHQAALGSVPRSIADPLNTNETNISGFLNMLVAAKDAKNVKRMVYAASSSTYGDSPILPKVEGIEGSPLSPYAVTKLVNELYSDVFSRVYNFHTIGLRYFNVFGPRQNANNPYAAVIPIFCKSFIEDREPLINGNGETSRDFTFVENAVQANIKAMLLPSLTKHEIFNMACGEQTTLNEMVVFLQEITGKKIFPTYGPERPGDVKHSKADITKIQKALSYTPNVKFQEGLKLVYKWYLSNDYSS
jgi:UDP-N-acetylglucosamine 4-epimerase